MKLYRTNKFKIAQKVQSRKDSVRLLVLNKANNFSKMLALSIIGISLENKKDLNKIIFKTSFRTSATILKLLNLSQTLNIPYYESNDTQPIGWFSILKSAP